MFGNDYFSDYGEFTEFGEMFDTLAEGIVPMIGIFLIVLLFSFAIALAFYLLQAYGLYKMGKTVGSPAPWLAFIPVVNIYALGKIAETPTPASPKPLRYGPVLLVLNVVNTVISNISAFMMINGMIEIISNYESYEYEELLAELLTVSRSGSFIVSALSFAFTVFYYIALYKLFKLFVPKSATAYLIVAVFFSVALPIMIFCLRNKPANVYRNTGFGGTYGYEENNFSSNDYYDRK